ncbi:MAG: caspase family protein [Hyphomonas sp.]
MRRIPSLLRFLKPVLVLFACLPLMAGIGTDSSLVTPPQKIALVIANSDYMNDWVGDLPGVPPDERNVSSALAAAGFDVTVISDGTLRDMEQAIFTFRNRMAAAPADSTGFLYYTGQGASIRGGDDYLIPTDILTSAGSDFNDVSANFESQAVSVQDMMVAMNFPEHQNIVLALDTCRSYLPESTRGLRNLGRAVEQGQTPDFFIIWSAKAGDLAFDAPDGSAFSRALAKSIRDPGKDIREVFAFVQNATIEETEAQQYPEVSIQSAAPLVLNGVADDGLSLEEFDSTDGTKSIPLVQSGTSSGPRAANMSMELVVWESALDIGTAESISDFIQRFPDSVLIGQAKLRLAALQQRGAFAPPPVTPFELFEPDTHFPGPARIALLIGNTHYAPNMTDLTNPQNDVDLIKDRLLAAGFEVMLYRDVDPDEMAKALSAFTLRLTSTPGPERPAAFFYYSGHGLAPDEAGPNYLAPVGMKVDTKSDLFRAQSIEKIMDFVEATRPSFAFYVLDACRNNPGFADDEDEGMKGDAEWKTITRVDAVMSSLVAFATAPGARAADTPDKPVGPYAAALADALSKPGLDATRVFKLAQRDVFRNSGHKQVPWISDALMEDFYFLPEEDEAAPAP